MEEVLGAETVYRRSCGSIPIAGTSAVNMGIPSDLMGLGLPGDNLQSPIENFHQLNFYKGIDTVVRDLESLGQRARGRAGIRLAVLVGISDGRPDQFHSHRVPK